MLEVVVQLSPAVLAGAVVAVDREFPSARGEEPEPWVMTVAALAWAAFVGLVCAAAAMRGTQFVNVGGLALSVGCLCADVVLAFRLLGSLRQRHCLEGMICLGLCLWCSINIIRCIAGG